ncbi:MAG: sulfatase [Spirochaetia bacterium]
MKKPNVILINCDDLGYGDLSCYGSEVNSTPALDKLAREGIRFTDFYMASPVCSPSRGAMLTGCYPPRIGFDTFGEKRHWVLFPGMGEGLDPDEYTLGNLFRDNGYATKLVGKWHCGDQEEFLPTKYGFDSYYGIPYSNDMGVQAGGHNFPPLPLIRDNEVIQEQPDQSSLTERYVEESVRFIRENKDRGFFLYFAHMYVHLPIYVPDRFRKNSRNGRYGAAVECIDWAASVLMAELEKQGIAENTIVMFTSDNGSRNGSEGGSNRPLKGGKGQTWEGGMRLPFIIRWPEAVPAGRECSGLSSSIDLLPTLAGIIGSPLPGGRIIDGTDITPLLKDPGSESPRKTFFYYKMDMLEAVRHGSWKLHVSKNSEPVQELYNLTENPGEENNLYDSNPGIVRELKQLLEACREDLGDSVTGVTGKNRRACGKTQNPKPLTRYDESHPYIIAEYDLLERG